MRYLRAQILKIAEKKVNTIRQIYADRSDLVDNDEIIAQYIFDVMNVVRPTTRLEAAYDSTMIFEAIKEDSALKIKIFTDISKNTPGSPGSSPILRPFPSRFWMKVPGLADASSASISTIPCSPETGGSHPQ